MGDDHIGLRVAAGDGVRGLFPVGDNALTPAGESGLKSSGESKLCPCGGNGACKGERGLRIGDHGLSNGEGGPSPDGRGLMGEVLLYPLPIAAPFIFAFLPTLICFRRYCTTSVWTSKESRTRVVSTLCGSTARCGSMRTDVLNFVPGTYKKHLVPV